MGPCYNAIVRIPQWKTYTTTNVWVCPVAPRNKIILALFVVALLTYLPYHVVKDQSLLEHERLEKQVKEMEKKNKTLRADNMRLEGQIRAFRNNPKLVERYAREHLMLLKPNEKMLVFPDKKQP